MKSIITLFLFASIAAFGQTKQDSLWIPFQPFIGAWAGTGEGVDGNGTYERTYQFVLNKKYIEVRNKTVYPVTNEKPKGYVHEDVGYISYDKTRRTYVFRQFHAEGFINQYILDSLSGDRKTMVFLSEAIENIPNGWRARETYIVGDNTLTEIFNLAEPNKDFEPYTKAVLRKKK